MQMELVSIIVKQIITMFLFMGVGFLLFKRGLITKEGSKSLANLLLYGILPCVVIKSFCVERTPERVAELGVSTLLAVVILLLSMAISALLFRKHPIDNFGAAFSNAGFMGFPLIAATLGSEAVFYAAGFVALLNALQWTYGQYILSDGRQRLTPGGVVKNPLVLALAAGLCLFFLQIPVPELLFSTISAMSAMNSPVAMIVLGVYLAQTDLLKIFTEKAAYRTVLVRLVLIPAVTMALCLLMPKQYMVIGMTLLIANAAPIGSNAAVYAQKLELDYTYAVKTVCLSTLLSIVSMPAVIAVFQLFV